MIKIEMSITKDGETVEGICELDDLMVDLADFNIIGRSAAEMADRVWALLQQGRPTT